jgi:hypothetical protein
MMWNDQGVWGLVIAAGFLILALLYYSWRW